MLSKASDSVLDPQEENGQTSYLSPSNGRTVSSSAQANDGLVRNLLQLTQFSSGLSIYPRQLIEDSKKILELIQTTVNLDGDGVGYAGNQTCVVYYYCFSRYSIFNTGPKPHILDRVRKKHAHEAQYRVDCKLLRKKVTFARLHS